MPDTDTTGAPDKEATGGAPSTTTNTAPPTVDTPASDKDDGKDLAAELDKWRAMARKHEAVAKQNADAAKRLAALEDKDKTESQKLADQLAAREVELAELRTEQVRTQAGRTAGLDPEMWEFITASEPAAAEEQAKRLAKKFQTPEPGAANLRQGARQPAKAATSANDILRSMAGYS